MKSKAIVEHPAFFALWALGLTLSIAIEHPVALMAIAAVSAVYHLWRMAASDSHLLRVAVGFAALGAIASAAIVLVTLPSLLADMAFVIARVGTAGSWTIGLAAAIDSIALRRRLYRLTWFRPIAELVDANIFHGSVLADQWRMRLEAAGSTHRHDPSEPGPSIFGIHTSR